MKRCILVLATSLLLAGCPGYEQLIKEDLKIPFVFMPPNDANHPYTLFMYTDSANFQPVCDATRTTGLTTAEIINARVANKTSTFGIRSEESVSVKVGLTKAEIGSADMKYSRVDRVELNLDDGKIYSLPSLSISDIVTRIANSSCGRDARIYARENPGAHFIMPTTIFGYDLRYRIFTSDGVDVTAELPPQLAQLALRKAGVGYASASDTVMAGDDLYVGFRGTSIDSTLATTLQQTGTGLAAVGEVSSEATQWPVAVAALPEPHPTHPVMAASPAPSPERPMAPALFDRLIDVTRMINASD